ncbi:ATP-dependent DNA helicase pif1-like [Prorops nasuta]|uniref:ATP-dependent DNA helicase pif1-like n=1 Tax=Prorops nasuta TaxID=863751 RepID=UPI0034CF5A0F
MDYMKELINKNIEESNEGAKCSIDLSLECVPIEVEGAMKDFQDVQNKYEDLDVSQMISELNSDQERVFNKVTKTLSTDHEILTLYVSGEGGTGKSFLIKTIRCWIKKIMKKDVIVSAPTGIAAFNMDGLTIHRVFQLPVEHGRTAKYTELSDVAIKVIREELKNVTLIIIDEISMISNVTLMYIHLRLVEIFNTKDLDNGWFGGKHILLFGDLLQLPPVRTIGSYDFWTNLFSYDELTINMRQKADNTYKDILSKIRIGIVQDSDTKILLSKKINFKSIKIENRMQELCDLISTLSSDTVCLLLLCPDGTLGLFFPQNDHTGPRGPK